MKQGNATSSSMGQTRPGTTVNNMNVQGVAQIGKSLIVPPQPIISGRGVQAPVCTSTSHPTGSQGKR